MFASLMLGACPSTSSPDGDAAPTDGDARVCEAHGATLWVGTDSTARTWRALDDGDAVYLTPGPQGAQHVWVGLRARGVDPTQPRVEMNAYRVSDGELIGRLRVRLRLIEAPEDSSLYALSAQPLIIEDDRYCSVLSGDVRITIDFDDGRGHCVRTERRVHLAGIDPLALPADREARLRCCEQRLLRCFPPGSEAGISDATAPGDTPGDATAPGDIPGDATALDGAGSD